eukprot:GGOE01028542.1.p1 GENE.GGOE01028542.1~~GGOE01028542.1.p1  ORF type:complete len:317 (+),score=74.21 GGOE01028542.1:26-952(+)
MLALKKDRPLSSMSLDVLIHATAGLSAGAISTVCCHPIDSLKTRIQAQEAPALRQLNAVCYSSSVQAVRTIYHQEGLLAFYQGMAPALIGSACAWGLYFGWYQYLRAVLSAELPVRDFIAASAAGIIGTTLTSPIWLIKTRLQLYERGGRSPSMLSEFRLVLRTDGPPGLFRGLVPQLLLVLNPSIQLTLYEQLKAWCCRITGRDPRAKLPDRHLTACIVVSKTVATTLTTPLSVIKVRMQDPRNYNQLCPGRYSGMLQSMATIYRGEGLRGFFRGLAPTLVKPLPGSLVTFLTYEWVSDSLKARFQR